MNTREAVTFEKIIHIKCGPRNFSFLSLEDKYIPGDTSLSMRGVLNLVLILDGKCIHVLVKVYVLNWVASGVWLGAADPENPKIINQKTISDASSCCRFRSCLENLTLPFKCESVKS